MAPVGPGSIAALSCSLWRNAQLSRPLGDGAYRELSRLARAGIHAAAKDLQD
jgi:hypothetical protein